MGVVCFQVVREEREQRSGVVGRKMAVANKKANNAVNCGVYRPVPCVGIKSGCCEGGSVDSCSPPQDQIEGCCNAHGRPREGGDAIGHRHHSDALCTHVVIVATSDVRLGLAAPRPPMPGYFKSSTPCSASFSAFHDPPHPRTTLLSAPTSPHSSPPRTTVILRYS